jgi:putative alpha-1,2-mannosidase
MIKKNSSKEIKMDKYAEQALLEYNSEDSTPRPGGVNGRPYWNISSSQFMFAPKFHFPKLPKSRKFRYIAKDKNGAPRESFDPFVWGYDYTESGAYQNAFGAPHALDEIAECLGGKDGAIKKLDEIFLTPPHFEYGRYGCEIHEMTEMAEAPEGLGQCAISNQPSFSLPFLYAYYGQREKSDYYVKKIATECFTRDSYPGDEDNGSMSAWYIFATLGKYPICPGSGKFTETTPLCKFKINE